MQSLITHAIGKLSRADHIQVFEGENEKSNVRLCHWTGSAAHNDPEHKLPDDPEPKGRGEFEFGRPGRIDIPGIL